MYYHRRIEAKPFWPTKLSEHSGLIRNIEEMLAGMVGALREVSHWLAEPGAWPAELLRAANTQILPEA